jgi:hypothetical protein
MLARRILNDVIKYWHLIVCIIGAAWHHTVNLERVSVRLEDLSSHVAALDQTVSGLNDKLYHIANNEVTDHHVKFGEKGNPIRTGNVVAILGFTGRGPGKFSPASLPAIINPGPQAKHD